MQKCKNCNEDWLNVGKEYSRLNKSRVDYYCTACGSKLKPIECVEELTTWKDYARSLTFEEKYPGLKPEPTCTPYELLEQHREAGAIWNVEMLEDNSEVRVLVIPDIHTPFMKEGAIEFLKKTYDKYNCNQVVCLGDEIDFHYSSFHNTDPDGMSAEKELQKAVGQLSELAEAFSVMKVCYGNHSDIAKRQAYSAGLTKSLLKDLKQVYLEHGAPVGQWEFSDHFIIDGVKYTHGTGRKAKARMVQDGISVVQGHYHAESYVQWHVNQFQKMFAMQLGALVDDDAYAFAYGKHFAKSHKNCGVVINGVPTIEYMEL